MNAGLHELPLVFFTVLAQSAVGALILMAVYLLFGSQDAERRRKIINLFLVALVLLGIGFTASTLHLGSPWRAFNSLNRIGASALSNEIASGALFFALAGLYWLLHVLNKMPAGLDKPGLVVIILSGCIFMYIMSSVYLINTVPTWNNPYTPASFILTAILAGFTLAYVLLYFAGLEFTRLRVIPWILVSALLVTVLLVVSQAFALSDIQTSVQKATALVPDYSSMMMVRIVLLFAGIGLLFYRAVSYTASGSRTAVKLSLCCSVVLVILAEFIGRTVFYGLHMTVGTAIAG